jgi:hypothetical protein
MEAPEVFISYRRADSEGQAGRLYDRLARRYGSQAVFRDIDALAPGRNFVAEIDEVLGSTSALVAVIGRDWLNAVDDSGNRRLDDPSDTLRVEIATALNRDVLVIPVLVGGAKMPSERDLPDPLKPLARINALEIDAHRWDYDVGILEATLEEEARIKPVADAQEGSDRRSERGGDTATLATEQLIQDRLDATGSYMHINSYEEIQQISHYKSVLLFIQSMEKGGAEARAKERLRSEVLPALPTTKGQHEVLMAWTNLGGAYFNPLRSDLSRRLKREGVWYLGCHLFRDGKIIATRKAASARWTVSSQQLVRAGTECLAEVR